MRFDELTQDTPRLVITYRKFAEGKEAFQWGAVGSIPALTMVGEIMYTQDKLRTEARYHIPDCPELALVVAWDEEFKCFERFLNKSIPTNGLLGMLEVVKLTIVLGQLQQPRHGHGQAILGPDGMPFGR